MRLIDRVKRVFGGVETKAAEEAPVSAKSLGAYAMLLGGSSEITPHHAWSLYKQVGSLAKVVDLVADQVAAIEPLVSIGGREEKLDAHPVIDLLKTPGYRRTLRSLIKELSVQQLVCGTGYPIALGNVRSAPNALDIVHTRHVITVEGTDGWPDLYHATEARRSFIFQRVGGANPRYLAGSLAEIVPVYDVSGDTKGVGLSRLSAVQNDVEMKLKGLLHNQSLLDKGATISGIYNVKQGLTEDQASSLLEQIREKMSGFRNAGGIMVSGGGEAQFVPLSLTPKDLDWSRLTEIVDQSIVDRYGVPQAIYSTKAQTYNNYELAWRAFYDLAVLPTWRVIYEPLSHFASLRFGDQIEFHHDPMTIDILAKLAAERATKAVGGSLITVNEGRAIIGYEPLEGGDDIYAPSSLVPVAGESAHLEDMTDDAEPAGDVAEQGEDDAEPAGTGRSRAETAAGKARLRVV